MELKSIRYPVTVSQEFLDIVNTEIKRTGIAGDKGICITFGSRSSSPARARLRPVEMSVNNRGRIQYISVFSIDDDSLWEDLILELDFDIRRGLLRIGEDCYPIDEGKSIFRIWQNHFCYQYREKVFDEIIVTIGNRKRKLSGL